MQTATLCCCQGHQQCCWQHQPWRAATQLSRVLRHKYARCAIACRQPRCAAARVSSSIPQHRPWRAATRPCRPAAARVREVPSASQGAWVPCPWSLTLKASCSFHAASAGPQQGLLTCQSTCMLSHHTRCPWFANVGGAGTMMRDAAAAVALLSCDVDITASVGPAPPGTALCLLSH